MAKSLKKDKKKKTYKPKPLKVHYCDCNAPRFNGDMAVPKCTVCGGEIV